MPAPPGGTADMVARVVGEQVSRNIGQPVIVENKPGGSGAIAAQAVLATAPDGRTLFVGAQNVLSEVPLVLKLGFDPRRDLKPAAEMARSSLVLIAEPKLKAENLKELVTYAKANPGKLSYASYSPGTVSHYAGLVLNRAAGIDLVHVPYKGSPPALQELVGGQVPLMFDGLATSLPLIRAGRLRAIAIASRERTKLLPQVPTFRELGYAEMEFGNWIGAIAPAAMAPAVAEKINAEVQKAVATPPVRERLAALGLDRASPAVPAELERSVQADYGRNAAIVKAFNITFD
ncbi:MAG TPA: tripartite tricarboxylate transporter substrate binding protein [Burkholderiales bacterium]